MIEIKTEGSKTKAIITLSIGYVISFSSERGCELDALLLRNQILNDLYKKIETIRKEAYEKGWKDAKAKKIAKPKFFNGNINSSWIN